MHVMEYQNRIPEEISKVTADPQNINEDWHKQDNRDLWDSRPEHTKILKEYLEDNVPPDRVIQQFWSIIGKTLPLTFLDSTEIPLLMLFFDQTKRVFLMSNPEYTKDQSYRIKLENLRLFYYLSIKRAVGSRGVNERVAEVTIQRLSTSKQEEHLHQSNTGKGVIGKLRGILR